LTSPYLPHPPVNAHYLHIYGTPAVTSVAEVCEVLEFCLCVSFSNFYHSICQLSSVWACNWWSAADDDVEFRRSLLTMAAISTPCAAL